MQQVVKQLIAISPELVVIGTMTLIQIAPIKINPWSWIGKLIRKAIGTTEIEESIEAMDLRINALDKKLDERIADVKRDNARTRSKTIRKDIIIFAENCRRGHEYSVAEFEEVGRLIDEYRCLIARYGFKNEYCVAQMDFIKEHMKRKGVYDEELFSEQQNVCEIIENDFSRGYRRVNSQY